MPRTVRWLLTAATALLTLTAGCVSPSGHATAKSTGTVNSQEAIEPSVPAAVADESTYLAPFSVLAKLNWPNNRRLTIVCHGHSVPAGYFKTPEVRSFDAYPLLLHQLLGQKYNHAVISVITTAKGGENAQQGRKRFKSDVLALRPDVVFIDYALNDRTLSLEAAREAWVSMIEDCRVNGIKVVLMTPTPDTKANLLDPADPLNQHAEQIRNLAATYHLGLVDSLKGFEAAISSGSTLDSLMVQSNHPNRAGHEIVAQLMFRWFP